MVRVGRFVAALVALSFLSACMGDESEPDESREKPRVEVTVTSGIDLEEAVGKAVAEKRGTRVKRTLCFDTSIDKICNVVLESGECEPWRWRFSPDRKHKVSVTIARDSGCAYVKLPSYP